MFQWFEEPADKLKDVMFWSELGVRLECSLKVSQCPIL